MSGAERPDVQHGLVAIDFLPASVLRQSLRKVARLLGSGHVTPLQHLAFNFADSIAAFRQFAHAQHIGKVAVRAQPQADAAVAAGCYAISGGMGALGMLAARWLASQGQVHVLLLGRSGR